MTVELTKELADSLFTQDAPAPAATDPGAAAPQTGETHVNAGAEAGAQAGTATADGAGGSPPAQQDAGKVKVGDEEYTLDQLSEHLQAFKNKEDWQKSNTQAAQGLAPFKKLIDALKGDEDARTMLQEYYEQTDRPEVGKLVNAIMDAATPGGDDGDTAPAEDPGDDNPLAKRVAELEALMSDEVAVRKLADTVDKFLQDGGHKLADADKRELLATMMTHNLDAQSAFKLTRFDAVENELRETNALLQNARRNTEVVNEGGKGARSVAQAAERIPTKDLRADHPAMKEYMENLFTS